MNQGTMLSPHEQKKVEVPSILRLFFAQGAGILAILFAFMIYFNTGSALYSLIQGRYSGLITTVFYCCISGALLSLAEWLVLRKYILDWRMWLIVGIIGVVILYYGRFGILSISISEQRLQFAFVTSVGAFCGLLFSGIQSIFLSGKRLTWVLLTGTASTAGSIFLYILFVLLH